MIVIVFYLMIFKKSVCKILKHYIRYYIPLPLSIKKKIILEYVIVQISYAILNETVEM